MYDIYELRGDPSDNELAITLLPTILLVVDDLAVVVDKKGDTAIIMMYPNFVSRLLRQIE